MERSGDAVAVPLPPVVRESMVALARLQRLVWKEEVVKKRESTTLARMESDMKRIAEQTMEIALLRESVMRALTQSEPLDTLRRTGGGSQILGYGQEQELRKLLLYAHNHPKQLAKAVAHTWRTLTEDEMADLANFVVFHLFFRCDRSSHPESRALLAFLDELHRLAADDAQSIKDVFGTDTIVRFMWQAYFRRTAKPYLTQVLREAIRGIAEMPEMSASTNSRVSHSMSGGTPGAIPTPAIGATSSRKSAGAALLNAFASTPRQLVTGRVDVQELPSTPATVEKPPAERSTPATASRVRDTPVRGGFVVYPPVPLEALLAICKGIVAGAVNHVQSVPKELRELVRSAWHWAADKFGTEDALMYDQVCAVLYSALFSEAVVFPELSDTMEPLEVNPSTRHKLRQVEIVLGAIFAGDNIDELISESLPDDSGDSIEDAELFRSDISKTFPVDARRSFVDSLRLGDSCHAVCESVPAEDLEWPVVVLPNDLFTLHRVFFEYPESHPDDTSLNELLASMGTPSDLLPLESNRMLTLLPRFRSKAAEAASQIRKQASHDRGTPRAKTKSKIRAILKNVPKTALQANVPIKELFVQQRHEALNSTGGRLAANTLYETLASMAELPEEDQAHDFLPFVQEMCRDAELVLAQYVQHGFDAAMDDGDCNAFGCVYSMHALDRS